MEPTTLGYIAGLFDGEGCVQIVTHKRPRGGLGYRLCIALRMTAQGPLDLLVAHFGGKVYRCPKPTSGGRTVFQYNLFSEKAANFLRAIEPLLIVKRAEARCALEFQDLTIKRPHPTKGERGFQSRSDDLVAQQAAYRQHLSDLKKSVHLRV